MSFGRYFEEFRVGAVYKHWPGRTLSEADDSFFSILTMNHNPFHIDAGHAGRTRQAQRVVAGPLVFATAVGMSVPDVSGQCGASLGYDEIKHAAPVFHGDTIYAETEILDLRESQSKPDQGVVQVETKVRNQRGELVLRFRRQVLVPRREHAAEARPR